MPTEEEFAAFHKERRAKRMGGDVPLLPQVAERFPATEDQFAYLKWATEKADKKLAKLHMPIPRAQLAQMIDTINYNNKLERDELASSIHKGVIPFFHAGTDAKGDIYRVVSQPYGLLADQALPKTDCQLVSPNVLGVNLNVQPALPSHQHIANYSEESTQSDESDDAAGSGFVFHQVGMLEMWTGDKEEDGPITEENVARGPWFPADFGVVVRIDRSGEAAGIYIIYDFYPLDVAGQTFTRPSKRPDSPLWGRLGDLPGRITVAKIADSMSELRFGRTLSPTVVADYPVELVRAAVGWDNSILRVTVMEDGRP